MRYDGFSLLLTFLFLGALTWAIFTRQSLGEARATARRYKSERDAARQRVAVLRSDRDAQVTLPGKWGAVACESCGDDDGTHLVCTDCLTATPDPWTNYRNPEHDAAMRGEDR